MNAAPASATAAGIRTIWLKAQSPPAFLGGPTMRDAGGKSVTNPLFIVYGCFNVL